MQILEKQITLFEFLRKPEKEKIECIFEDKNTQIIVDRFLETLYSTKPSFSMMLAIRTDFEIKYISYSKAIWKASLVYCQEQSIEWYLKTCSKMNIFKSYPKKVQCIFIDRLLNVSTFDEIDVVCEELGDKYQYLISSTNHIEYLFPSDYCKVMILKATNEKDMAEILNCCGGFSKPINYK